MKRVVIPEILDLKQAIPQEVADSLDDLRRINHWFGGINTSEFLVRSVAQRLGLPTLSLLDVGSATGEVPKVVAARLKKQYIRVEYTLLDREAAHFGDVEANYGAPKAVQGNALSLPFSDNSFDAVSCSLFAHHLEPNELVHFSNEALRVARHALLINDLKRSRLHLALVLAGTPLYRSRATRHDAPVSVRRSYTKTELRETLTQTRAVSVEITGHYLYRMGVIAWKH